MMNSENAETQMCKLWPQWLYSLQLSSHSAAKESCHAFVLHLWITGSTAAKLAESLQCYKSMKAQT